MKSLTFEEARELFFAQERKPFSFVTKNWGIKYTIFGFAANIFPADSVSIATKGDGYLVWLECKCVSTLYQNKPIPFKTPNYDWRKV